MKKEILNLRQKGWSYNKIAKHIGCSKSTISYHCNNDVKEKTLKRSKKISNETKNNYRRKRVAYYRELIWRYKRLCGCAICGNKDPRVLDYDHINGKNKIDVISRMVGQTVSKIKLKKEIRKCQILCSNCHRIKTFETFKCKKY
jgi:5-methylcytosine-specific restriction endonuclease McrA